MVNLIYDEKPIINYTEYNLANYREFNKSAHSTNLLAFVSLFFFSVMVFVLPRLLNGSTDRNVDMLSISFAILFLVLSFLNVRDIFFSKKRFESVQLFPNLQRKITFREESFDIDILGQSTQSVESHSYSDIYKVRESANLIYLYLSSQSALMIDKNNFHQGELDDFRALLRAKVPNGSILFKDGVKQKR